MKIMELNYWIRVALAMAAMYLTFKVFMSRENFHALNRTTILLSVALSFVLPLLKLPAFIITYNSGDVMPDATIGVGGIVAEFAGQRVFRYGIFCRTFLRQVRRCSF